MGTQPNKKLAKRGTKIRSKEFQNDFNNSINKEEYEKAATIISKAVRKNRGSNYIVGILAAGIAALETKKPSEEIAKKVSGDAVTKIPKNIKNNLTLAEKDSIRLAVYNTLTKESGD